MSQTTCNEEAVRSRLATEKAMREGSVKAAREVARGPVREKVRSVQFWNPPAVRALRLTLKRFQPGIGWPWDR